MSKGSPGQWTGYRIDIGEEQEMLETVDPTWQTTRWLQLAVQGISDDEVPWYEYVALLTMGTEGAALLLAKHLLAVWRSSIRVQGQDICPPTPTVLNIGQFMTWDEVQGDMDNSLWFEAYSRTLQLVREAVHGWQWQWPKGKVWEVAVSGFAASCTRLCWELPSRGVFRRRERGAISHTITFLDDMAVHVPMLNTWDQFVWPPSVAIPQATMEAEQYGYHHGNAIDLSTVMPVMEFRVTDEEGPYLCVVQALIFEGSILAYNPARDEAEWVPTHGGANDLSWAEERTVVTLTNFVPHVPQEADPITELGTHHLLGWSTDSSLEEEDKQMQEEDVKLEGDEPEGDEHEEIGQGEADPKPLSSGTACRQSKTELEI